MSAKVKVKKVGNTKEINEMFNQMLGTGDCTNMNICYPKYIQLKGLLNNMVTIIEVLSKCAAFQKYPQFSQNVEEMKAYHERMQTTLKPYFTYAPSKAELNMNLLPEAERVEFSKAYTGLKDCQIVKEMIIVCDELAKYRKYIEDETKINHKFIIHMNGAEFKPFGNITELNLKELFLLLVTESSPRADLSLEENTTIKHTHNEIMRFILLAMRKIYNTTFRIYKIISSPDIDVNEFVEVVLGNLDIVKKQIGRCDKAFKKIEESVHLLKDNFNEYYKDFLETKSQSVIMENFVLDVAKNTDADVQTTNQFRKIINFYRKQVKNNVKNPQVLKMFEALDDNFKELSKNANIAKAEKGEFVSDEELDINFDETSADDSESEIADDKKETEDKEKA